MIKEVITEDKFPIALVISIIAIGINIIITILNIISNFILKNKEKSNYSHNKKEDKRIEKLEECYNKLERLTYFDGKTDNELFYESIAELDHYVIKNKLYINKKFQRIINDFNDYFKIVLADHTKKDYRKEITFLDLYTTEFNK